jgi:hypothetical protein
MLAVTKWVALFCFIGLASHASEDFESRQSLLKVRANFQNYEGELQLSLTPSGGLEEALYQDILGKNERYTPAELRQGVVVIEIQGIQALGIRMPELQEDLGGRVELRFMRNFTSREMRRLDFEVLKPEGSQVFIAQTRDAAPDEEFHDVFVDIQTTFGIPRGVQAITFFQRHSGGGALNRVRHYVASELPRARSPIEGLFDSLF